MSNQIPFREIRKVRDLERWASAQGIQICDEASEIPGEALVRLETSWGLTYRRSQDGKVTEELNFTEGHPHRYVGPEGEERVTFDFDRIGTDFAYSFQ
tara:strand:- start:122 stop:415 length:294 start_codon:yes stop_codon:yes gene_type:complete